MAFNIFQLSLKKPFLWLILLVLILAPITSILAADLSSIATDSLIKAEGSPEVYYYAPDGKRYLFPNEKIYKSWFIDFSSVIEVDAQVIGQIPLGGNIYYRPGIVMVKIPSNPKVYVVAQNGVLRSVKSEALAKKLYGDDWAWLVDDLPESFFVNYTIGKELESEDDFDADTESEATTTLNHNHHWQVTNHSRLSDTSKCRAVPAVPAKKVGLKGRATPAIPARDCAHAKNQTQENNLTLNNIQVATTTTIATISWTTNATSTSQIEYATTTLATATNILTKSDNALVTSHSLILGDLAPATVYYYRLTSVSAENKKAASGEKTLTTAAVVDATAPIISSIVVVPAATTATISWTTNEISTSLTEYATTTLASTTNKLSVSNTALVTAHQLSLIDLTASTTYYYILKSTDASSNTATTSETTFTTN